MRQLWIPLIAAGLLFSGCATVKPLPQSAPGSEAARFLPLPKVVRAHARQKTMTRGFDTTIDLWAIYEGWEYTTALLETRADAGQWTDERKAEETATAASAFDANVSFVLAVYTSDADWAELDEKDPIWSFFLTEPGEERAPSAVTPIKLPEDERAVAYPFVTRWHRLYRVTYPREGATTAPKVALRMTSIFGRADLEWEFR